MVMRKIRCVGCSGTRGTRGGATKADHVMGRTASFGLHQIYIQSWVIRLLYRV